MKTTFTLLSLRRSRGRTGGYGPLLGLLLALLAAPAAWAQTTVFSHSFESGLSPFTAVNGSQTNKWQVGTAAANGPTTAGTQAAYLSNDNGSSHAYTLTTSSTVHLYRDVTLPVGEAVINLGFDWRGAGEAGNDYLRVQVAPTSFTPTAGSLPSTSSVTVLADLQGQAAYGRRYVQLPAALAGTTQRLIFSWTNNSSLGTQPPAALDNVELTTAVPAATALSGTYTINQTQPTAGTNFNSFTAAAASLNANGVSGPVTINVAAGQTFTEQIVLNQLAGSSSVNKVTFNGNGSTLQFNSPNTTQMAIIRLDGADFVTFDNLTIASLNTNYGWGVHLLNGADNNQLTNCTIGSSGTSGSSYLAGVVASSSNTSATTTGGNPANFLTVRGCTVTGGYYGIVLNGTSNAALAGGHQLTGNQLRDFHAYGIHLQYTDGAQVVSNDLSRPTHPNPTTFYGIYLTNTSRNLSIARNRIHSPFGGNPTDTNAAYGIYCYFVDGAAGSYNHFFNNLIYDFNGRGTQYGVYTIYSNYQRFYHNTISLDDATANTTSPTYGIQFGSNANVELKNNLISVTRSSDPNSQPVQAALYLNVSSFASDYNDLYVGAGPNYYTGYNNGYRSTLANWQAAPGSYDQHSVQVAPAFADVATANYAPTAAQLNNTGTPLAAVTIDITGAARSATAPDPGAYEFSPPANDAAVVSLDSPNAPFAAGTQSVLVTVRNNGAAPLTSVALSYVLNGGGAVTQTFTGLNVAPAQTTQLTLTGVAFVTGLNTLTVTSSLPNGTADANASNDAQTRSYQTALSGAYTINSGAAASSSNFVSFTAAVAALNAGGVAGPVTFAVSGGPYVEQVELTEIVGSSATNTVVFNGGGSTIRFNSSDQYRQYVIRLNGADYVTIDNLVITALGTSYAWGVHLLNAADHNQISNCVISVPTTSGSGNLVGIVASNSTSSTSTSGNTANDLRLTGNTITGGYYGILLYGSGSNPSNTGWQVLDNQIRDFYYYGVYLYRGTGAQVTGNDISRPTRASVSEFYGIYLYDAGSGNTISRNRIHHPFLNSSSSGAYGIYLYSVSGTAAAPNLVANNLVYGFTGTGQHMGLRGEYSAYTRYYHNTVAFDNAAANTSSATYGLYITNTGTGTEVKNNVVVTTRNAAGSGNKYALFLSGVSGLTADYNDLFVGSGPTFFTGSYNNNGFATLANWKTANSGAYDQNSVQADPSFVDLAAGNLTPRSALLNGAGTPLAAVTTDFAGTARSNPPDLGAYEFTPSGDDAEVVSIDAPNAPFAAGSQSATVTVRNNGATTISTLTLSYVLNGGAAVAQSYTGLALAPTQSTQLTLTGVPFVTGLNVLTVTSSQPNGVADVLPGNDAQTRNLRTALNGAYTINSGAAASNSNFVSFTTAVAALNEGGVLGAVTFDVAAGSGPYVEQVSIREFAGASATNTVTFNGNGRTLQAPSSSFNGSQYALLQLDGADYVRIDNLTFNCAPVSYSWGLHLTNGADHNQLTNCTIDAGSNSTSGAGIVASGSGTSAGSNGNAANDLLLSGNTITGGYYGIILNGLNTTTPGTGWQVTNNVVRDFYAHGVYLQYGTAAQVVGNDLSQSTRTSATTFYGLYLSSNGSGNVIERNRIHDAYKGSPTNGNTAYGIFLTSTTGTSAAPNQVANNLLYNFSGTGQHLGIYNNSSAYTRNYHNTVSFDNAAVTSGSATYGLYVDGTATGVEVKNNLVTVTRNAAGTGSKYALYYYYPSGGPASDYNDLFVGSGANFYTGYYNGTSYATLASWKTANGGAFEQHGVAADPLYTDAATGNYQPTAAGPDNTGTPLASVTTDITGAARSATTPDLGAYEFVGPGCGAVSNLTALNQTSTAADISFTTIAAATSYTLTYTPQGGAAVTLSPAPTTSPVALTGLTPGTTYAVSIVTNCASGTSSAATFSFTTKPSNDDCANAATLAVNQSCVNTLASNLGATVSAGSFSTCYGSISTSPDVWYKLTVPGNGVVEITTSTVSGSPATYVYYDIYAGSCGSLSRQSCGYNGTARLTGRTPGEELLVRVYTINSNSAPGAFNICATTDPCVPPTSLSMSNVTYEAAQLNFVPGTQVTDYTITYTPSGGAAVTVAPNPTGSPVQLTGLLPSTSYTVRVTSNCGGGLTSSTASVSFSTQQVPCTAPTNLATANLTHNSTDITFTAGSASTSYTVSYGPQGGSSQTATVSSSPVSLSGLLPSTTYNVTIINNCSGSRTATSATFSFTTLAPPCNAPTALATGNVTTTSADLSFTAGAGNTGFALTATPVGGGAVVSASGAASPLSLTGLLPSTQYTLSLTATCAGGATTTPVTTSLTTQNPPCVAPSGLAVGSITSTGASLSFTPSGSALSYRVTYTPQGGSAVTISPNPTASPVALTGLTPNTQYSVSVVSNCANSQTSPAATVTFTTAPPPCIAPTGLSYNSLTGNSVNITFAASASATNYTITYTPSGGTAQTVTVGGSPATLSGLTPNTAYAVSVVSNCVASQTSAAVTTSFTTPCAAPAVTLAAFAPVCQGAAAFDLTGGAPSGGSYSGPGVSGGQFSATTAGVGTHTITYSYTDGNGCTGSATRTLQVLPTPTFAASATDVCAGQPVTLTVSNAGAGASYAWSTGASTASITVNPAAATTYSVTVTNAAGCAYPFSQAITIKPYTAAPGAVSQMQPIDNSNGLSLPIAFSWAPGTDAASYSLYVWPVGGTQPATPTVSNISGLAYTYNGALPYGQQYNWRVASVTPCGSTAGPIQTFGLRQLPDVRVSNIVVPDTAYAGQTMELTWNVTNIGLGSTLAQQWQDAVYISQDSVFSASATLVGRRGNTTYLQPNGTYITTATFAVPYSQAGRYYVFVRANDNNALLETTTANNRLRATKRVLIIVPETPDFSLENFVSPPDNSVGYTTVQMRYRVYNRGTVDALTPRRDEYFISPDTIQNIAQNTGRLALGPNAISLGSQTVRDTLLPGGYYQRIVSVRIPHTEYGTRYFYAYTDTDNNVFETASTNNVNRPVPVNVILRPPADLAPFTLTAPAGGLAGTALNVTWDVRNGGLNAPVAEERYWADKFWLSPTATFDPNTAIAVGTLNVFGGDTLLPGHHYRRTVSLNIPNGLSGQYYVFGMADYVANSTRGNVFEYTYEGNNMLRSGLVNIGLTYADLEPTVFTAPATIDAFQTFTVSYTVRNNGAAVGSATGTWSDEVHITTPGNSSYVYCGSLVGKVSHTGPLAPGQSYSGSMTLTIPRWVEPGQYELVFATDQGNTVYEYTFEGNNTARQLITYRYSDDLRLTALTSTGTAYSGQTIGVNWQVDNQGAFRTLATAWNDQLYLSTDNVLDAGDLLLNTTGRNSDLAVGATYGVNTTVRLPHGLQGNFYLIAKTGVRVGASCGFISGGGSNVLVDTDPANNVRTLALPITLTPPCDLVVDAVTFPTDVVAGQQVTIPFTIRNQGVGATLEGDWNDGVYVNTSPSVNGALRIGNYFHPGTLAAGATYSTNLNVTIPAYLSGNYYIFLVADNSSPNSYSPVALWGGAVQYGKVYEHQQELNNTAQGNLLIRVPQPADLVVTSVDMPTSRKLGQTMTIHYQVKNQGVNPAVGQLKDGLYLSQDMTVDGATDPLFATRTRNLTIQPNQTIAGTLKSHVQAIETGTYNGLMATNLYDDIYEGAANNNNVLAAANQLQIGVDVLPLRTNTPFALDLDSVVFYKVTPGANKDMVLSLTSNQQFGQNEVYVGYNRVPSAASYDFIYTSQVSPNQELLIPSTGAGDYYILVKTPYVYAGLQTATLYADTLGFQVRSITADHVGQGRVTTQVLGAGYNRQTRFFLTQGADTTVLAEAEVIRFRSSVEVALRWRLDTLALGQYNVVAQNGTTRVQLTDGLTVEPARALSVDFATIIPPTVRVGTSANWTYFLKNTSNVDVPYWEFQYNLPPGSNPVITHTDNVRKKSDFHPGAAAATTRNRLSNDQTEVLPFVARDLRPDEVIQVNLRLTPPRTGEYPVVWNQAAMTEEWFTRQTLDHIATYRQAVLSNPGQFPTSVVVLATDPAAWQDSLQRYYQRAGLLDAFWLNKNPRTGYTAKTDSIRLPGGICGTYGITESRTAFRPDPFAADNYPVALLGAADSTVFTYKGRGASCTIVVGSSDPNLIVGPNGLGEKKMVGVQQTLNYQVQFENDPLIATAPAQVVRISVPLSPAFEVRSFRLGSFGWGNFQFGVPTNVASYTKLLDLPDSLGYDVRVVGTVDVVNKQLLWQFETIDPATGLAPLDPNKGFLLINDSTGRGQGFVNFTIQGAATAFTGDTLAARASIVFDTNEPLQTNRWWNILDAVAPSSHVNTLAATQPGTQVQLSWTAGDDPGGSGLRSYDLYASRDGGPFAPVATNLSTTSYTFTGIGGARYDFFTLATDSTENREALKLIGDTYTVLSDTTLVVYNHLRNQCLVSDTIVSTGAGVWQYLKKEGQVVAAINDRGVALGKVAVEFSIMEGAPVRSDAKGVEYLDRNWHLYAQRSFAGRSVDVRFFAMKAEFDRFKLANDGDANDVQQLSDLRLTQYSGPNEDCLLTNNVTSGSGAGQVRLLTPATSALAAHNYFVSEVSVADHFSEFYLNGGSAPLPVELLRFTAARQGRDVRTAWQTATERNSAYFAVEATNNPQEGFREVGRVEAKGASSSLSSYGFTERNVPTTGGLRYYRLRQVDLDGKLSYGPVATVQLDKEPLTVRAVPNPFHDADLRISIALPTAATAELQFADLAGRVVARRTVQAPAGETAVTVPELARLPSGVYLLTVRVGQEVRQLKLVKE